MNSFEIFYKQCILDTKQISYFIFFSFQFKCTGPFGQWVDRNDKSNTITNSDTKIKLNPDCPKGEGDRIANIKDKVTRLNYYV